MALKLADMFVLIGLDTKRFKDGMQKVESQMRTSAQNMDRIAGHISGVLTKAFLGGGAGGAWMMKMAASYEQGMARVKAISNATGKEFEALGEQAKYLGATTVYTAREAADAMGFFALAGYKADKIMAAMPQTLDMAAAGQMSVVQAADIASKIMAGMGIETKDLGHALDVMTKAMTTANTDLVQLGEAMKYVGPVAKSSSIGIEGAVAAIQMMSNAGIQASMAGTSLRQIITKLSGGTKEAQEIFSKLGVSMVSTSGKIKPLGTILDDLNEAMKDMGEAERVAAMMTAFGQRAGPAMVELLDQGGQKWREFTAALVDSEGTTKRIADIQLNTLQGSFTIMTSAIEGVAIAFGEKLNPQIRSAIDRFTELASSIARMNDEEIKNGLATAEMAIKWGLAIVAGNKMLQMGIGLATLIRSGGPIGLGVTALTTALGLLGITYIEAKMKGEEFGDMLAKNIALLTNTSNAVTELDERMNKEKEASNAVKKTDEEIAGIRDAKPSDAAAAEKNWRDADAMVGDLETKVAEAEVARQRAREALKSAEKWAEGTPALPGSAWRVRPKHGEEAVETARQGIMGADAQYFNWKRQLDEARAARDAAAIARGKAYGRRSGVAAAQSVMVGAGGFNLAGQAAGGLHLPQMAGLGMASIPPSRYAQKPYGLLGSIMGGAAGNLGGNEAQRLSASRFGQDISNSIATGLQGQEYTIGKGDDKKTYTPPRFLANMMEEFGKGIARGGIGANAAMGMMTGGISGALGQAGVAATSNIDAVGALAGKAAEIATAPAATFKQSGLMEYAASIQEAAFRKPDKQSKSERFFDAWKAFQDSLFTKFDDMKTAVADAGKIGE